MIFLEIVKGLVLASIFIMFVEALLSAYLTVSMSNCNVFQKVFFIIFFIPSLMLDKVQKAVSLLSYFYGNLIFALGGTSLAEFKAQIVTNLEKKNNLGDKGDK